MSVNATFYLLVIGFIIGYDYASFKIMRKIDTTYKYKNLLFVGYNTYNVWKNYRKYKKGQK